MQIYRLNGNTMKAAVCNMLVISLFVHLQAEAKRWCSTKTLHLTDYEQPGFFVNGTKIRTSRPIIGVLTQETTGKSIRDGKYRLAATYVKFLESAGARVAPIFINSSMEYVEKMFRSLNGVVFPGGHVLQNGSRYYTVGKKIFELALQANAQGDVFPIWGECQGMELVASVVSGIGLLPEGMANWTLLYEPTDAKNVLLSQKTSPDYKSSRLLGSAPKNIVRYLRGPIGHNNHVWGITPQVFYRNTKMRNFFRIVSTSLDRRKLEFISTLEAREPPVYLFQWHPAKSTFEWDITKQYVHSQENVLVGQYFADFFVNEARLSGHRFASPAEEKASLIYNFTPKYTGDDPHAPLQTYFW